MEQIRFADGILFSIFIHSGGVCFECVCLMLFFVLCFGLFTNINYTLQWFDFD